jgi:hypothetical protein
MVVRLSDSYFWCIGASSIITSHAIDFFFEFVTAFLIT